MSQLKWCFSIKWTSQRQFPETTKKRIEKLTKIRGSKTSHFLITNTIVWGIFWPRTTRSLSEGVRGEVSDCGLLAVSGGFRRLQAASSGHWRPLAASCRLLAASGGFWRLRSGFCRPLTADGGLLAVVTRFPPSPVPPFQHRHHRTRSNTIKHHQTSSNNIEHHRTSSNIIKHHQTSWNVTEHLQTSSSIIKHVQTSSSIRHHQASSNSISNIPWNIGKGSCSVGCPNRTPGFYSS